MWTSIRLLAAALCLCSTGTAVPARVVGYYADWTGYGPNFSLAQVPGDRLTHLGYAFWQPAATGNGSLVPCDPGMWAQNRATLRRFRVQYPRVSVGLAIGGASSSGQFSRVFGSPTARANFIRAAKQVLQQEELDFIDLDWETPGAADAPNLGRFCAEAAAARLPFSIAASGDPAKASLFTAAPCPAAVQYYGLMTYDFSGPWSPRPDDQTSLQQTRATVQAFRARGVASDKLVIGSPLYGRGWTAAGVAIPNTVQYRTLIQRVNTGQLRLEYNADRGAARAQSRAGEMWSLESPASARAKVDYIQREKLGGVMLWELSGDAVARADSLTAVYSGRWRCAGCRGAGVRVA